jgi:hypothetical protein
LFQDVAGARIRLTYGILQQPHTIRNVTILSRNEQVSGSSPLVGSLFYLQNPQNLKASDQNIEGFVSSTSAVDFYPEAPSIPSAVCLPMLGSQCV